MSTANYFNHHDFDEMYYFVATSDTLDDDLMYIKFVPMMRTHINIVMMSKKHVYADF
jgi:hypothetical protein